MAKKATNAFPVETQNLPVELFYYFQKSYKGNEILKKMQFLYDIIEHKLLKPPDTRWLVMHQINCRLSEQWEVLKTYFNSDPTDFDYVYGKKKER